MPCSWPVCVFACLFFAEVVHWLLSPITLLSQELAAAALQHKQEAAQFSRARYAVQEGAPALKVRWEPSPGEVSVVTGLRTTVATELSRLFPVYLL